MMEVIVIDSEKCNSLYVTEINHRRSADPVFAFGSNGPIQVAEGYSETIIKGTILDESIVPFFLREIFDKLPQSAFGGLLCSDNKLTRELAQKFYDEKFKTMDVDG